MACGATALSQHARRHRTDAVSARASSTRATGVTALGLVTDRRRLSRPAHSQQPGRMSASEFYS